MQALVALSQDVNCDEYLDSLKSCDETATVKTSDLCVTHIRWDLENNFWCQNSRHFHCDCDNGFVLITGWNRMIPIGKFGGMTLISVYLSPRKRWNKYRLSESDIDHSSSVALRVTCNAVVHQFLQLFSAFPGLNKGLHSSHLSMGTCTLFWMLWRWQTQWFSCRLWSKGLTSTGTTVCRVFSHKDYPRAWWQSRQGLHNLFVICF